MKVELIELMRDGMGNGKESEESRMTLKSLI